MERKGQRCLRTLLCNAGLFGKVLGGVGVVCF
jgi:hypothetical protein